MSFKLGANVGPYQVIEQLGQGGMASVYKAYHAALDRYVALKVLHQAFNEDSTFISRFQREAKVVAKLEHPNIVPVYDFAEHEGRPFLVMKFIEGDTLKARMSAGPLTAKEIEQVVETVGSAVGYAHRQGVLHRDIKPSNVLISTENVMYLADFGLARIAQAGESTLSADSIMGTPQYISPEQAMGKKDLDGKTDVYSFGVMIYEMVVGQVPFNADTPFSIIHDHIYTPLPLPKSVNPSVPDSVQRVLLKSLAKNRDDRYATVEELIAAFKSAWLEAGMPMRGTTITVGSAVSAPAVVPAKNQARSEKSAREPNPLKSQKKKRSPWMWVSVGVIVSLCFCITLFAIRNSANQGAVGLPDEATLTPFIDPSTLTPFVDSPPQDATPLPPPGQGQPPSNLATPTMIPPEVLTPEIQAAYEQVRNNPGDPNAHLQLSLAFWDAGLEQPAAEEYGQATNLAGPGNQEFYLKAAQDYKTRSAWHFAAGMYLRVMPMQLAQQGVVDEEIKEAFRESAYKAAPRNDFPLIVSFDQLGKIQLDFLNIVRGRHELYNGNIAEAEKSLDTANRSAEFLPEVYLLRAEIAVEKGNTQEAVKIFEGLINDTNLPSWLRAMAEEQLKTIQ
ncbi:MAG: serine/threonine protein kinase [Anaerolineae bacterium]|nr:serine/threonine protein kinase [Anaerolineae bacterium]